MKYSNNHLYPEKVTDFYVYCNNDMKEGNLKINVKLL